MRKWDQWDQPEKSISITTGVNAAPSIAIDGDDLKKKKKTWNTSKTTYYSYNKKIHYASDCTKPKK